VSSLDERVPAPAATHSTATNPTATNPTATNSAAADPVATDSAVPSPATSGSAPASVTEPAPADPARSRPGRRRSKRAIAVAAVALVGLAAVAAYAAGMIRAGSGASGPAEEPPATATITRQTLIQTMSVDGVIGHGPSRTVTNRLSGTVTWLPEGGTTIDRGGTLYRIDDLPVILFFGDLPAYRDLGPGDTGTDVAQLEQNLAALGYSGFTVDDEYTWQTAEAVRRWQRDLGLPRTGRVELGRVVFAPEPVLVEAPVAQVGGLASPGQDILSYTGTRRVVTIQVDIEDRRFVPVGTEVTVELPDGRRLAGTIEQSYAVVEIDPATGRPSTVVEAVVSFEGEAGEDLDQIAVDVSIVIGERPDVLTVPVAALVALAEGGYGIEVIEGSTSRYVAVETGLFAGGRVEIRGPGIAEGMTVVMPS